MKQSSPKIRSGQAIAQTVFDAKAVAHDNDARIIAQKRLNERARLSERGGFRRNEHPVKRRIRHESFGRRYHCEPVREPVSGYWKAIVHKQ
jgi:hypothetical protein